MPVIANYQGGFRIGFHRISMHGDFFVTLCCINFLNKTLLRLIMSIRNIRIASLGLLLLTSIFICRADENRSDFMPEIHGTIRPRFEMLTDGGEARFQVRNARLSLNGSITPLVDYYFNTDFCDRGSIKILDVWTRIHLSRQLSVQAGQFRMPFGVDPFRGPHTYLFANRSFIGKQVANVRAVGVKLSYTFPTIPLTIEGGAFNPTTIGNHESWNKDLAYAAKISYRVSNVTFTTGIKSVIPDGVRTNLIDGCVGWKAGRWQVEGEYMNKHYTNSAHKASHAYCMYASYSMPVKTGMFNRLSFQGRFDGMTDHSNARRGEDGKLETNDPSRNRMTIGSTISCIKSKNTFLDLRVNYENYFYHHDAEIAQGEDDKIVVELVLRF